MTELTERYPEAIIADGLDGAIMGADPESGRVIYSIGRVLDILQERDGMEYLEALEFAEFNIFGAYVGEKTPIWAEEFEPFK